MNLSDYSYQREKYYQTWCDYYYTFIMLLKETKSREKTWGDSPSMMMDQYYGQNKGKIGSPKKMFKFKNKK